MPGFFVYKNRHANDFTKLIITHIDRKVVLL